MGKTLEIAGVIASFAGARIAKRSSVNRMVKALQSQFEDTRTAAYIGLVKLGPRIDGVLLDIARTGGPVAEILQVLGDHENPDLIPQLREFLEASDPKVVAAAKESITLLQRRAPPK